MVKAKPEYTEGPEAFERFRNAMRAVVAVPHPEIQKRIEQQRREAGRNPHKRGPKPKCGASRVPAA